MHCFCSTDLSNHPIKEPGHCNTLQPSEQLDKRNVQVESLPSSDSTSGTTPNRKGNPRLMIILTAFEMKLTELDSERSRANTILNKLSLMFGS
jgi:hypothetical protein